MQRTMWTMGCGVALGLLALGCGKKETSATGSTATATATEAPKPTAAAKSDPAAEAKKVFETKCVVCHGTGGKGDGAGAAALNPKPQDFSTAEWQDKVKDDEIKKAIVEGGPAVGKSPGMAPNPDLKGKEDLLNELVKIIRGFKS